MTAGRTTPVASPLAVALFEGYSRASGNDPAEHFDRAAAEQWKQQALEECGHGTPSSRWAAGAAAGVEVRHG